MYRILETKRIAPEVILLRVEAPLIARKAEAGQFVILRVDERGERIPLTLADWNREKGEITLVFQQVGLTTKKLAELNSGDSIRDLIGPLGNPAESKFYGTVTVVGGGVGIAPAYPRARQLKSCGNHVISIIGARTSELLILEDWMKAVSDELYISTDDGTRGRRGFVSDVLKDLLEKGRKINYVFAVGPVPMMRAVAMVTRNYGIRTDVSLNSIMVDGTGMCGACRVTVGGETKFTCVDGPEFNAHEVDFQELTARLNTYVEEERRALEICKGGC